VAAGGNVGGNPTLDGDAVWAFKLNGNVDQVLAPPAPVARTGFGGPFVMFGQPLAGAGRSQYDKTLFDGTIPIDDFFFTPGRVQVPGGTTVTWQNNGGQVHTATDSRGAWDTGEIAPGQSASVTFATPGLYTYNCVPHPWMLAQIQVQ
jgi:plastocyanin